MRDVVPDAPDPLDGQPTDEHGIPLSIAHAPQTDLPVWQFIHKLAIPLPNRKSADRPYTHICILCAAAPPLRSTRKKVLTWRNALMRQRMSTNAVAHMQRVHPEEFVTIADYKLRKRNALVEKAEAAVIKEKEPKKKKVKRVPDGKKKAMKSQAEETQESEASKVVDGGAMTSTRKRPMGKITTDLVKNWLLSSGAPISMLQDKAFQQLLRLLLSNLSTLPTAFDFSNHVHDEFAKFRHFLGPYLAAEAQAAMGLPFLTIRHEFRPIVNGNETDDVVGNKEKAFFSVALGFIDSQWRRVDLVLAAKEVAHGWNEQVKQLLTQTMAQMYDIQSILNYTRFHVAVDDHVPSSLASNDVYEPSTDDHEDLLTHALRRCVIGALDVGPQSSFGAESSVRRILRLLQELMSFFALPDQAYALAELGAAHSTQSIAYSASSNESLAFSTSTSIGAIANLLKTSCARFPSYCSYFESAVRPTATKPELELAWTQLTTEDWRTVTEIEAILNHLGQFRLENRVAPRPGVVAPSYAMLFRRLLSVTANASSFKCLSMEKPTIGSLPAKAAPRRKAKHVESFTSTGRQCLVQLRQLIAQNFPSPSTPLAVDDEIKAMLLDPRISSKVANLVTDSCAFRRAQEALRQEHRVAFELLAARQDATSSGIDEEIDDDDDDDEISALLMVDGPKNQPPAASSTMTNGKRSREVVAEDEARAWREWQQVYVAWDTLAQSGADLFDKGQYNLLKLYHHVNILKWFRDVGQQAHPAASLLARIYLSQQPPPSRALGASLLRFTMQDEITWVTGAAERAEKRCILHHNWHQYQQLSANTTLPATNDESPITSIV